MIERNPTNLNLAAYKALRLKPGDILVYQMPPGAPVEDGRVIAQMISAQLANAGLGNVITMVLPSETKLTVLDGATLLKASGFKEAVRAIVVETMETPR